MDVSEDELRALYAWVDSIPSLSRLKRSLSRDFADGVLLAEIVSHYYPRLVDLHNYSGASGTSQKLYNWRTLNQKVFKRLGFVIAKGECEAICRGEAGAAERVLKLVKVKLAEYGEYARASSRLEGSHSFQSLAIQASSGNDRQQHARHHVKTSSVGDLQPSLPRPLHVVQRPDASILSNIQRSVNDSSSQSQEGSHDEVHEERCMLETDLNAELAYRQELINHLQAGNEALQARVDKLEELLDLKNAKIQTLLADLHAVA